MNEMNGFVAFPKRMNAYSLINMGGDAMPTLKQNEISEAKTELIKLTNKLKEEKFDREITEADVIILRIQKIRPGKNYESP